MNQDNLNIITPINNSPKIIPVPNINNNLENKTINNYQNGDSSFAKSLPNWDLVPEYQVVRRVLR